MNEFNIFYYINLYKKCYKIILLIVGISMFLTMCSSFLRPRTYVSTLTLITSDIGQAAGTVLGKFLAIPDFSSSPSSNAILIAILKSKRMKKDIDAHFDLAKNRDLWWEIYTSDAIAGLRIDIHGPDPSFTKKVADEVILNIGKMNEELDISIDKSLAKILDPPEYGEALSRNTLRKMLIAGMFSFLASGFYVFFLDFLKRLKSHDEGK